MIGKPQWFKRRKYTGWGFTPATWQGWVYILVIILPIILIVNVMRVMGTAQIVFLVVWAFVFMIDFVDIMIHLPKDERDHMHEAISERNALWAIVLVLAVGVGYQTASSAVAGIVKVDPVIIIAVLVGLFVKIVSNIYLDKKD